MIEIKENNKKECCGCTACMNICPVSAIEMRSDEEGFLYPVVDKEKCINCGLCEKTCPIINKKKAEGKIEEAYALRAKDEDVLETSTSGGFFTPIANWVLKNDGVVIGVGFGEELRVEHMIITNENKDRLPELRGSKYVQSYLGDIFKKVKEFLENEKIVLFSGTPCQIQGLIKFLNKDYDNLITVDLICHGVPSPKLWKEYTEYQENKYHSKIKKVNFRNKTYGYHSGTMKLTFDNGKKYYGSARVDYMLKSFFAEISSRPSCYDCKFKDKQHISDFTIFDCWNVSKSSKKEVKDDDKGYTNIFVNTRKGKDILNKVKQYYILHEINIDKAIELDGIMVENSAIPNKNRKEYYKFFKDNTIENTIQKFIPVTKKDIIIENLKSILYKTGLLNKIKEIKSKN